MINLIARLKARAANQDRGATAVEYGLMVALIAAVIIGVVFLLGEQLTNTFQSVVDGMQNPGPGEEGSGEDN